MGIQIAPEMVDGLTIGYATGEYDESATVLGVDVSTMWVKYVYGSITVGYQESEDDGPTSATTDESKSMAISYAVSDDFSVSYGKHEYDDGDLLYQIKNQLGFLVHTQWVELQSRLHSMKLIILEELHLMTRTLTRSRYHLHSNLIRL